MASNDGQRLTVFGLGFRQHDSRKMHRILDHYERLPNKANDRAALYANLTILARDLPAAETQSIEMWLANDGDFPFVRPVRQSVSDPVPPPFGVPQGGLGRHGPPHNFRADRAGNVDQDEHSDFDSDEDMDDEFDVRPPPPRHAFPPPHRAQPRHGINRHRHVRNHGQFEGNNEFGRGQLFGEHGNDDEPPAPEPRQAPRNPPRPPPRRGGRGGRGGFAQLHGGALDPFVGHGPLPEPLPRPPIAPPPHRMQAGRPVRGFGQALPGILDPFMGHGPPMGFALPGQHQSAFDITGPGRRLGEEGEETPPGASIVNSEEAERYEEIFNEDQENNGQEVYDEMNAERNGDYIPAQSQNYPITQNTASRPSPDPTPEPTMECEVCYEDLPVSEFPPNKITAVCQHEAKVCYGCLEQGISVQIQEGVLGQLRCPSCPEKLSYEDIQAYASPEIFKRYDYLLSRTSKDMFMCLAPNCGAGQIHHGGKDNPMMICQSCDFKVCTIHGRPWHEGQTCREFDCDPSQIERLEEEEATAKLLAQDSRICQNCGQGVTKQIGCDHMLCRCGKAWCFVCEADWENILRLGGPAHARHCIYHPDHVRKGGKELEADRHRALHAVHGGEVSEELRAAQLEAQDIRRKQIREEALKATQKRLEDMKETKKEEKPTPPKKRKPNLKPAWEEGGHARRPF